MEMLEKLRNWLGGLSFWQGNAPEIDKLSPQPGATGLFPLGAELVGRKEDVLGNVILSCRHSFLLKHSALSGKAGADWCEKLHRAARNTPPELGQKTFITRGGSYEKNAATGVYVYEIRLEATMEEKI